MIKLMVGNNCDPLFIDNLIELNKKYKDKDIQVTEVFGSIRGLRTANITTARPDFRVPVVDYDKFKEMNKKLKDNGIRINYTINSPLVDHRSITKDEVAGFILFLEQHHVSRVTVAHPLLMKLISQVTRMEIEVSTIYRVRHPRQLFDLKEMAPNITKVCMDVNLNRDRLAILEQHRYCQELGIELELIANEFCINNCIVRDQCYHAHVINKVVEDTLLHEGYPMGYCISHREKNPKEWLYANFILPQHMKIYKDVFGIEHFKITGRTGLTTYLSWVTEQYLKQNFEGNLLELWQDVKNIKRLAKGGQDYLTPKYMIDTKQLDDNFLMYYIENAPISFDQEKAHVSKYLDKSLVNDYLIK